MDQNKTFEKIANDLSYEVMGITGPMIHQVENSSMYMMMYDLIYNDPDFSKFQDVLEPNELFDGRMKDGWYPEACGLVRQYTFSTCSNFFGGNTHFKLKIEDIKDFFVNFLLDRDWDIITLNDKEIKKSHWKLKEDTGHVDFLWGITKKEDLLMTFIFISGEISQVDINTLYSKDGRYQYKGYPSYITNCWGSIHQKKATSGV